MGGGWLLGQMSGLRCGKMVGKCSKFPSLKPDHGFAQVGAQVWKEKKKGETTLKKKGPARNKYMVGKVVCART